MTTATVKARLCIISDTHTSIPFPTDDHTHAYRQPFPKSDVLLHCGDITKVGYPAEYERVLSFLKTAPAELKLVIAGNHDITLHKDLYLERLKNKHRNIPEDTDAIREMWTGEEARDAGIVYLEEGVRTFELRSGARFTVYSSPWQPEFYDWAFTYPHYIDRFNPTPASSKHLPAENPVPAHPAIDIMLTHCPPKNVLDKTAFGEENVGCPHLRRAVERCKPRVHCFGHIHEGWGAERITWSTNEIEKKVPREEVMFEQRAAYIDLSKDGNGPLKWGEETLFINASIMDVRYRPVNAPWIVDLDFPINKAAGASLPWQGLLNSKLPDS